MLHFQKLLTSGVLAFWLGGGFMLPASLFSSCSKQEEPAPVLGSAAAVSATLKAQAWFARQASAATNSTTSGQALRGAATTGPAIDWARATYSEAYVVAPFVNTTNPFADAHKYGYRFLVVRLAADSSCTGRLVELVADKQPLAPEQAASLALAGAKPLLNGQEPGAVPGLTGWLLVYSPTYQPQIGLVYEGGTVQPLRISLMPEPQQPIFKATGNKYALPVCVTATICGYAGEYLSNRLVII